MTGRKLLFSTTRMLDNIKEGAAGDVSQDIVHSFEQVIGQAWLKVTEKEKLLAEAKIREGSGPAAEGGGVGDAAVAGTTHKRRKGSP